MQMNEDAMLLVRADLCERLEAVRRAPNGCGPEGVDGIKRLASAYGLMPVVRLAEALERAMRRPDSSGCQRSLYLDRLRDAIGCERLDEQASVAMLASVSVRLG